MTTRPTAVLLGDSLTADAPWPEWLPDFEVLSFAAAGSTSTDAFARCDEAVAADPALIIVMAGTNDVAWGQPLDHTVRTIQLLVHRLRRGCPRSRILVHSVLPREPRRAAQIRQINCHVRQYALTVGAEYVDLWPTLADVDRLDESCSDDLVTLTAEGYERWRGILTDIVRDASRSPSRPGVVPVPVGARRGAHASSARLA